MDDVSLVAAVSRVLAAGLPDRPSASRPSVDAILGYRQRTGRRPLHESPGRFNAALTWALVRSGRAAEAARIADREGMIALHDAAPLGGAPSQSACYALLAEAYLVNGRLRDSVACGRFAQDYAEEADDDAALFRALGITAAAQALSGDIRGSIPLIQSAVSLGEGHGWMDQQAAGWTLLGRVLVQARRADAAAIRQIVQRMEAIDSGDIVFESIRHCATLVLLAVEGGGQPLLSLARQISHGPDAPLTPPYFRDLAVSMEAIGHVQVGEPGAALDVLRGRVSPAEHSVCFELLRATAHLALGDFHQVLDDTDGCVRNVSDHSIVTFVSILLRRALALDALGHTSLADEAYAQGTHLAYDSGLLSATLGIPVAGLTTLMGRLTEREPEFAALVMQSVPPSSAYADPSAVDFDTPELTKRESVLAEWLTTDLSMRDIAQALHVSINTVKSQGRTLYRKLGVTTREDAVLKLRRMGRGQH